MNTPLLYSWVPIAPSKPMTFCGSSRRAINGLSGNCRLRFRRRVGCRAAHRVVLRLRMMDDHRSGGLLGQELKRLGEIHPKRFLRRKKLEHRCMVVEVGARTVAPRIALATGDAELLLDAEVRPLGDSFG